MCSSGKTETVIKTDLPWGWGLGVGVMGHFPEKGAFMLHLEERNASQTGNWKQSIPNSHTTEGLF